VLQRVLDEIKLTGVPYYPWPHLRAVLVARLKTSLDEMRASDKSATVVVGWSPTNKNKYDERRDNLAAQLAAFEGCAIDRLYSVLWRSLGFQLIAWVGELMCRPPFTLQRLTEVILEPRKTYKSLNKLFNALEKVLFR
jgi:hypothetical protein